MEISQNFVAFSEYMNFSSLSFVQKLEQVAAQYFTTFIYLISANFCAKNMKNAFFAQNGAYVGEPENHIYVESH